MSANTKCSPTRQGNRRIITFCTIRHKLFGSQGQKGVAPPATSFSISGLLFLASVWKRRSGFLVSCTRPLHCSEQPQRQNSPTFNKCFWRHSVELVQVQSAKRGNRGARMFRLHLRKWLSLGQYKQKKDKRKLGSDVSLAIAQCWDGWAHQAALAQSHTHETVWQVSCLWLSHRYARVHSCLPALFTSLILGL